MMTLAELRQNLCQRLEKMEEEKKDNFDDETKKELIKSLRGMASHSSFSSEKFARQKQKEIDRE